ncbi:hypothetical protein [uncultured Prevotella sp.]|uniref:hypothetical protein n=1 Tax=uncultured Prevotella sp. TaxID=159272 RepID=UPI0025FD3EBD|nr:hypothetical protein [uncultured Prevotella sp.]
MKKKTFSSKLFLILGTAAVVGFSGCTDNDYDLSEIDSTIGIGGDGLEIPSLSTEIIPLKDVLELEANGSVVEDEVSGDYVFRQSGADVAPVHPFIDKITVAEQNSVSNDLELTFSSASGSRRRSATRAGGQSVVADGWIQAFTYEGNKPEEVVDLYEAEVSSKVTLDIDFSDVKSVVSKFDQIEVDMPAFMTINNVKCGGYAFEQSGSKLTLKNVYTSSNMTITADITSLNFKEKDTSYGSLSISGGKVKMEGKVHVTAVASSFNSGAGTTGRKISSVMNMSKFVVNAATGKFNPEIALSDLGNIKVSGIPDFLQGGNVVVDLYNPQIKLTVTSDMDVPGTLNGVIKSFKNGQLLATVNVDNIPIDANKTSTICICRRSEGVSGFDHVLTNPNLSKLIETIPDNITFSANASADQTNNYRFELGHNYTVQPAYSVDAPIAFGENASIEYRDTLDGWNDNIKDFELAEGAYVNMDASIKSCVPAYMTVSAVPVDVNGNAISADELSVEVTGSVEASKDGVSETTSPVNIKVSQMKKGAMKKLDGIVFVVAGKASDGNNAVTGITLNANRHTLKVEQLKIKLVGKLIGNFN